MSGAEKAEVLDKVASSGLPKRETLGELGVPRSTYYRWLRLSRAARRCTTAAEESCTTGTMRKD